jgi:hypothetical protein
MPSKRIYYIHDNRYRPFKVVIETPTVTIYKHTGYDPDTYDKCLKVYKTVEKVYIGKSTGAPIGDHTKSEAKHFDGNSILLELTDGRFVFIGHEIYEFRIGTETPVKFYSMVGNNDVPYPVFLTDVSVYMMLDNVYVAREQFPNDTNWENAYATYYGHIGAPIGLEKVAKKMKSFKMIQKRGV